MQSNEILFAIGYPGSRRLELTVEYGARRTVRLFLQMLLGADADTVEVEVDPDARRGHGQAKASVRFYTDADYAAALAYVKAACPGA